MQIIEKIFLSVIKNYYPCVHYFPCRKFHVHTAAKPLYKSQQPEPDTATNIQCSEVYKLYNDHPFDKPITTRHAKKMAENRFPPWTFSEKWCTKHTYQVLQNQ